MTANRDKRDKQPGQLSRDKDGPDRDNGPYSVGGPMVSRPTDGRPSQPQAKTRHNGSGTNGTRRALLSELFEEVGAELEAERPRSLDERLRALLTSEPLTPEQAALRLECSAEQVVALVAADPFGFVSLGTQVGVARGR